MMDALDVVNNTKNYVDHNLKGVYQQSGGVNRRRGASASNKLRCLVLVPMSKCLSI